METFLCQDGLHLADKGTNIFAANIVNYITHSVLNELWNEVACNDSDFEEQNRDIDTCSPENSSEKKDSNLQNKQNLNPLSKVKTLRFKNVKKTTIGQIKILFRLILTTWRI